MTSKSLGKWTIRALVAILVIGAASMAWVEYQLRRGRGHYTEKVDRTQFTAISGPMAITNVHVLARDGQSMIPNQTVLLDGGNITSVGQAVDLPQDRKVIDGGGGYLIPGLVDSHVHLEKTPNDLLVYLANGVTQIRDMGGSAPHLAMRRDTESGSLGPHMFITSEKVYCKSGLSGWFSSWTRTRINVATADQAKAVGKKLAKDGFDGIKISHGTTPEVYQALLTESKKHGIPVVGHIPDAITLPELFQSGQTEVAHVEEITKALNREFGGYRGHNASEFLAYVEQRADDVAAGFRDHNIAVTTTVWLMESLPKQKFDLEATLPDIALAYANPLLIEGTPLRRGWLPGNNSYAPNPAVFEDPERLAMTKAFWAACVEAIEIMTRALVKHDVPLLAGTDANTALTVPGFSLHDELKHLTKIGLSNAQSLYAATAAPGEWMENNSGRIAQGYRADLVLLRENPLENIEHTTTIESVFINGRYLSREQLDAMLKAVKQAHDRSRSVSIDGFQ